MQKNLNFYLTFPKNLITLHHNQTQNNKTMEAQITIKTALSFVNYPVARCIAIVWDCASTGERVSHTWIDKIDPDVMDVVRVIYKQMPGDWSLYDTTVAIMKHA